MIMATLLASVLLAGPAPAVAPMDGNGPSVKASEYRGKHYRPRWNPWRECVIWRESRDNPRAVNPTSSARGLYQFLDRSWRISLTHMVMREHKHRRNEVKALRAKPIHHWPRYWQDAAFWTVLNNGAGAKHWALQGSSCNRVRP
jgi:hypothetical protein